MPGALGGRLTSAADRGRDYNDDGRRQRPRVTIPGGARARAGARTNSHSQPRDPPLVAWGGCWAQGHQVMGAVARARQRSGDIQQLVGRHSSKGGRWQLPRCVHSHTHTETGRRPLHSTTGDMHHPCGPDSGTSSTAAEQVGQGKSAFFHQRLLLSSCTVVWAMSFFNSFPAASGRMAGLYGSHTGHRTVRGSSLLLCFISHAGQERWRRACVCPRGRRRATPLRRRVCGRASVSRACGLPLLRDNGVAGVARLARISRHGQDGLVS